MKPYIYYIYEIYNVIYDILKFWLKNINCLL